MASVWREPPNYILLNGNIILSPYSLIRDLQQCTTVLFTYQVNWVGESYKVMYILGDQSIKNIFIELGLQILKCCQLLIFILICVYFYQN
jgi:hypothetical protein